MDSCARGCGKAGSERLLRIAMKEPEHKQAERQVEGKDAQPVVPEGAVVLKRNEVLEIRSHAADDQGRQDETRVPERQGGGGVGNGKGHCLDYDGLLRDGSRWVRLRRGGGRANFCKARSHAGLLKYA